MTSKLRFIKAVKGLSNEEYDKLMRKYALQMELSLTDSHTVEGRIKRNAYEVTRRKMFAVSKARHFG